MNTLFLLMAQYDARAIVPLDDVVRDYFPHLTVDAFRRKVGRGDIRIPVTRIEGSQKSAQGVHLSDLAAWIDDRRAAAQKEMRALAS